MDWLFHWSSEGDELARWEARPVSTDVERGPRPGDRRDHHDRIVGVEPPGAPTTDGVARRVADAILRFDVFPPRLLAGVVRRRPVEIGDTVGLRYYFAPGIDLFFAARVIDRFEEVAGEHWRCGFTYRTLQGHPACGEETFVVEKHLASGQVAAALRSWSRPGIFVARLTYPVMRALQVRAARAALDHLEHLAHGDPEDPLTIATPTLFARRNLRTGLLRSDERW